MLETFVYYSKNKEENKHILTFAKNDESFNKLVSKAGIDDKFKTHSEVNPYGLEVEIDSDGKTAYINHDEKIINSISNIYKTEFDAQIKCYRLNFKNNGVLFLFLKNKEELVSRLNEIIEDSIFLNEELNTLDETDTFKNILVYEVDISGLSLSFSLESDDINKKKAMNVVALFKKERSRMNNLFFRYKKEIKVP